jgi:hypothetical protein
MKIEELVIIVFFLGVSGYAVYYLYNLWKVKEKILNQISQLNYTPACQDYIKTIKSSINGKKSFSKASEFITLEKLLKDNKINIRLYLAIPSLLVGLGVLGTFIGFSMTVLSINDLLDSSNQTTAMKNLFSSVKIAFASSVAGMFWSFIFSKCEKIVFHDLEEKINNRCSHLDDLHYQSHDGYIRRFIGNVEKSFTNNINNSFNLINQNLEVKITELLKSPIEALEKQSKSLEIQLTNWEVSLNAQNNVVIATTNLLNSVPSIIETQLTQLSAISSELNTANIQWLNTLKKQTTSIKQQESIIDDISSALSSIPSMTQDLDKINKTFDKSVKAFQKMETTLTANINNFSGSVSSINQAIAVIPQVNQSVQDFSGDIHELEMIVDTLEKSIKGIFQGMDSSIEQRMTRTTDLLNNYFSEIDKLSEKIVNTYAALNNGQKH